MDKPYCRFHLMPNVGDLETISNHKPTVARTKCLNRVRSYTVLCRSNLMNAFQNAFQNVLKIVGGSEQLNRNQVDNTRKLSDL